MKHELSRRQLLGGSSSLAAAALLGGAVHAGPRAFFRRGGSTGRDVYVQIFLRGAMDGLTTLVPHGDAVGRAAVFAPDGERRMIPCGVGVS